MARRGTPKMMKVAGESGLKPRAGSKPAFQDSGATWKARFSRLGDSAPLPGE